jgi:hypothetical protein
MNVRDEIEKFADGADKPVLRWLFDKYHMESQWSFVAYCTHQRYGTRSYQTNRVWTPTTEGRALHAHMTRPSADLENTRKQFEDAVFGRYFLSTIKRTGLGGCMTFMPDPEKELTQDELCTRAGDSYAREDVSAMWWGWCKALESQIQLEPQN